MLLHGIRGFTGDGLLQSIGNPKQITMFRIDLPHLAWVLEGLVEGEVRNQIVVDAETAEWARVALERMLAIT